jgi:hypothetical protein
MHFSTFEDEIPPTSRPIARSGWQQHSEEVQIRSGLCVGAIRGYHQVKSAIRRPQSWYCALQSSKGSRQHASQRYCLSDFEYNYNTI